MRTRHRRGGAIRNLTVVRPVGRADDGTAPPGELLSCYTAAVAHYLAQAGIDAELAVGAQLFLAVRIEADRRIAFVHHHTPLRGNHPTHRVELARCHTADRRTALARILDECRRTGAVVVSGDVFHIPWQVGAGQRHAPHWLVVDQVNDAAGAVHVTDPFEFVGEHGAQEAYAGWVPVDTLPDLCRPPETDEVWSARETHAFGDIERRLAPPDRYQWFEAVRAPERRPVGTGEALALLHDTWSHHAGLRRRPDLDSPEWHCGVAAIRALADWFEPGLADTATYAVSDDVWVAARNRSLFARVVGRLATETGHPGLLDLAVRAAEHADEWAGVPRVLAYNLQSLARGREPRVFPVTLLRGLADKEHDLLDSLGRLVATAVPAAGAVG